LPEPTILASFNMPPELHERLKDQSHAEDRSMRDIVVDALNLYFARKEKASPGRTLKMGARDLNSGEAKS
jgi:predicted transcriptional regulator